MKYDIIVADPPWPIKIVKKRVRPNQKRMPYRTMTIDQIKALPVQDIASKNSMCFLWAIDGKMLDAREVLKAWGFKYHLTMAWDKGNGMAMFGFNRQTEFVIVGFKGKHDAFPRRKTVRTSFAGRSVCHSAKPDEFYNMLLRIPARRRVDLFARKRRKGWQVWGNEVPGGSDVVFPEKI